MGFFADSVNRISPSQTIGMATKARELKAKGRDIVSLASVQNPREAFVSKGNPASATVPQGATRHP